LNPKIHYCDHEPDNVLHRQTYNVFKIRFNIILSSESKCPKKPLPLRFLFSLCAICPVHFTLRGFCALINNTFSYEKHKLWSSPQCSFLQPPVTSLLGQAIRVLELGSCNLSLLQPYVTCLCEACHAGLFIHRPQKPLVKNAYHSPKDAITLLCHAL
jgi:hypothetical protein